MKNLYTQSKLLSEVEFNKIESIFNKIWSKDTTSYLKQNEWSDNNKALGQCVVTSLVIYDLFGGKLIYDKPNFHVFNELPDGTWQDFSRVQFNNERAFSITRYQDKKEILSNDMGIKNKTEEKYLFLKKRFEELYKRPY